MGDKVFQLTIEGTEADFELFHSALEEEMNNNEDLDEDELTVLRGLADNIKQMVLDL